MNTSNRSSFQQNWLKLREKTIIEQELPLGPRVRPTASASLSIPACMADLDFWSNAISLALALTTNRFLPCFFPNFCPGCNWAALLFFNRHWKQKQITLTNNNREKKRRRWKQWGRWEKITSLEGEGRMEAEEIALAEAIFCEEEWRAEEYESLKEWSCR